MAEAADVIPILVYNTDASDEQYAAIQKAYLSTTDDMRARVRQLIADIRPQCSIKPQDVLAVVQLFNDERVFATRQGREMIVECRQWTDLDWYRMAVVRVLCNLAATDFTFNGEYIEVVSDPLHILCLLENDAAAADFIDDGELMTEDARFEQFTKTGTNRNNCFGSG